MVEYGLRNSGSNSFLNKAAFSVRMLQIVFFLQDFIVLNWYHRKELESRRVDGQLHGQWSKCVNSRYLCFPLSEAVLGEYLCFILLWHLPAFHLMCQSEQLHVDHQLFQKITVNLDHPHPWNSTWESLLWKRNFWKQFPLWQRSWKCNFLGSV